MYRVTGAIAGAILISAFAGGTAYALPTYTSGSFGFSEPVTTNSDITTTTSFANTGVISVQSTSGDFASTLAILSTITVPNPTDFTSIASMGWSDGAVGSFAASSITNGGSSISGTGANEHATQSWFVEGTFTVGSDYANAGATLTASETWSLTQTGGVGNAVSISATFNSPAAPPPSVPEPATLALLGAGLVGFAGIRRRRKTPA